MTGSGPWFAALRTYASAPLTGCQDECIAPRLRKDILRLLDEVERLTDEAKPGPMPHRCLNPECGTIQYGPGYKACPSCGGTEGRAEVSQPGSGA